MRITSSIVSQISKSRPTAVIRYPKSWIEATFKAIEKNTIGVDKDLGRFYEEIDKKDGRHIWLKQTPEQFNALSFECHQDLAYRKFGDDLRLEGTWLSGNYPIKTIEGVSKAISEACKCLPEYFQPAKLVAGEDIPKPSQGWYVR